MDQGYVRKFHGVLFNNSQSGRNVFYLGQTIRFAELDSTSLFLTIDSTFFIPSNILDRC